MNFEGRNFAAKEDDEQVAPKRESSQDIYKGEEGVDWGYNEAGFPRRIEKSSPDNTEEVDLSAIEGKLQEKETIILDVQKGINAAREKLGLPPTDEVPPSVQIEHRATEGLRAKRQELAGAMGVSGQGLENVNEKEQNFETQVNRALQEIAQGSQNFLRTLKEREAQTLTPLCGQEQLGSIIANFRMLSESQSRLTPESIQDAADTITRLIRSFEGFGVQEGGTIRESADNLTKLTYGVRDFHESIQSASKKFSVENIDPALEEKMQGLRTRVAELDYMSGRLGGYFLKLRQAVSGR